MEQQLACQSGHQESLQVPNALMLNNQLCTLSSNRIVELVLVLEDHLNSGI